MANRLVRTTVYYDPDGPYGTSACQSRKCTTIQLPMANRLVHTTVYYDPDGPYGTSACQYRKCTTIRLPMAHRFVRMTVYYNPDGLYGAHWLVSTESVRQSDCQWQIGSSVRQYDPDGPYGTLARQYRKCTTIRWHMAHQFVSTPTTMYNNPMANGSSVRLYNNVQQP